MRRNDEYYVIPCDCGTFEHSVVYHVSQFENHSPYIVIRFPLYLRSINPLTRIKNVMRGKFEFEFNITLDAIYFPLVEYLWKISFPKRIFEYEVMECFPHWKIYLINSRITLRFRPSFEQVVSYLRYGVLEHAFEIFIDEDGPTPSRYEKIL